jgi:hypothetical protein
MEIRTQPFRATVEGVDLMQDTFVQTLQAKHGESLVGDTELLVNGLRGMGDAEQTDPES